MKKEDSLGWYESDFKKIVCEVQKKWNQTFEIPIWDKMAKIFF